MKNKKALTLRPHVLIVEDSPTQAERLRFILESKDYCLTLARNGRDALDAILACPPLLIISDIVMPEMDGYELCARVKQEPRLRNIPVIMLTSLSDPVDVIRGLECGADNFIFKPYDEEHLLARIAYMLANRHLRESESTQMGLEIVFAGRKFFITSDRLQILNLLLSTYEAAVQKNRDLAKARDELRQLNEQLESKVQQRTADLQFEIDQRRKAEEEIRRLNEDLEERVRERTAQLEAANQELEAFSYSVSHDLRAPLRHVGGFVNLLKQSAQKEIPESSRRYLELIEESVQRMGQLIDDLLSFSRMGRAELYLQPVPLSALVKEVLEGLKPETSGRCIVWRVDPLPTVRCDAAMLRQVFFNLIGNAIKYSRSRSPAEIEIGARPNSPEEVVIHVRDNGVGFEMEYVNKLFGVFQRLHNEEEFEGTGIGLANVRRIIARHGGRTWAEGKVNAGATFYFSLPAMRAEARC
ncbi:MAG: response regulator [Verrucomicrobiota bacterium]